jgi:hypothetical protein
VSIAGLCAAAWAAIERGQARVAAGCVIAVGLAFWALVRVRRRVGDRPSYTVTSGPLRDRVFALAASAGVTLRTLLVAPAARSRLVNAFAVGRDTVVFTDQLLLHFTRREVDAVVAHEVAHLRHKHSERLGIAPAVVAAVGVVSAAGGVSSLQWPALTLAALLAFVLVSRRFERTADAGAVALTRDPEAMISALGRLGRMNHLPHDWGRLSGVFLTHPTTVTRVRAIAAAAGIEEPRWRALLERGLADDARDEPPRDASEKAFSTRFRAGWSAGLGWAITACLAAAPALACLLLAGWPRGAVIALGVVAALGLSLIAMDRLAARPYRSLRRRLAERLIAEGIDPRDATFAGLAPGDQPRLYEAFTDWDAGFLFVRGDRLCFVGEEARFALRRDQVLGLGLGAAPPGWLAAPRVVVTWTGGAFSLRDAEVPRLSAAAGASRRLIERLAAWRDAREPAPAHVPHATLETLGPPAFGEVTGTEPRQFANAATLVTHVVLLAMAAAVICALAGLPFAPGEGPGFLEIWAAASGAAALHRLPWWWRRDAAVAKPGEHEAGRRAA